VTQLLARTRAGSRAAFPAHALVTAARIVGGRPILVAVGLMGFLARGGVVLLVLPVTVLPTPIGLSIAIGAFNVTAAGPTDRLLWMIVATLAAFTLAFLAGQAVGVSADLVLTREALSLGQRRATPGLVARMLVVRLACLAPLAVACVWALGRLYAAGYHQLILPDDTATPLVVRILRDASDAAAVVLATWLITETIGGLAVRQVLVRDAGIVAALGMALGHVARRPVSTLGVALAGTVVLALLLGPGLFAAGVLWERMRLALEPGHSPLVLVALCTLFVASWLGALVLAGIAATWRSIAWSLAIGSRAIGSRAVGSPSDP